MRTAPRQASRHQLLSQHSSVSKPQPQTPPQTPAPAQKHSPTGLCYSQQLLSACYHPSHDQKGLDAEKYRGRLQKSSLTPQGTPARLQEEEQVLKKYHIFMQPKSRLAKMICLITINYEPCKTLVLLMSLIFQIFIDILTVKLD